MTLARSKRHLQLLTRFASVQLIVQLLTVITGFIVVRRLSKDQYAIYTVTAAMLTTVNILADGGLSAGMFAVGKRIWRDEREIDRLHHEARQMRLRFACASLAIVVPVLIVMLNARGPSRAEIALLVGLVIAGAIANVVYVTGYVILKLRGDSERVQRADLLGTFVRTLATILAALTLLSAVTATIASVLALWTQRLYLTRNKPSLHAPRHETSDQHDRYRRDLTAVVIRQAPQVIYFAIQGQLTIFLIGLFGTTSAVADIGAIGRISVVFAVVTGVVNTLIVPSVARCDERTQLRKRLLLTVGGYVIFSIAVTGFVWLAPGLVLWVLGPAYRGLGRELFLLTVMTSLGGTATVIASLNISRGWVPYTWVIPPLTIATQVAVLPYLRLSHLLDVITLGAISTLPTLIASIVMMLRGYYEEAKSMRA